MAQYDGAWDFAMGRLGNINRGVVFRREFWFYFVMGVLFFGLEK